jgi:hypothetical protein
MSALHLAELTPVPESPDESERPASEPASIPQVPVSEKVPSQEDPFRAPELSDDSETSSSEEDETNEALTGAAVSLAGARARLRQATIGNGSSDKISTLLKELEILSTKLDQTIREISADTPPPPSPPHLLY